MDDSVLNEKIREALHSRAERMEQDPWLDQNMKARVHQRIGEETGMKHKNWKKVLVAAAAICVLGSMTAMALGKVATINSHSSHAEEVTDYEQAAKMQKDYNSRVKTAEQFSNGYRFASAVPTYFEEKDDAGNVVTQGTYMMFTYRKQGMSDIMYHGYVTNTNDAGTAEQTVTGDDGTVFAYDKQQNKFVPPDYKPTDEELALSKAGKLNLAYGSSEVEETVSVTVQWTQDGIAHMLFSFDNTMSPDEMIAMAQEIAQSGK